MTTESRWQWLRRLFTTQAGLISLGQLAAVLVLGFALHWVWTVSRASEPQEAATGATQSEKAAQKWTCAMHTQIQKDGPGKCPICGMDLIPVESGATMGLRFLPVSPESRALMDIEVTPVERRYVEADVRMVGKVEYDETRRKYITARVPGRLDRLFVDYTGIEVKQGDHMADMYSEELYVAQQELIEFARRARQPRPKTSFFDTPGVDPLSSAREKLRLLGLTKEQIADIEKQKKPTDHVMIYAPMGGIVVEKLKQQGDRVKVGERIYAIADLSKVWVMLDAYESDLEWVRYGQHVEITTEAYPNIKPLTGRIAKVDPFLTEQTRTVKVRVNVDNPQGLLKPGLFVRGIVKAKVAGQGAVIDPGLADKWISPMHPEIIRDKPGKCPICGMPLVRAESLGYVLSTELGGRPPLVIPVSAVLKTGTRAVVYLELPRFPRAILNAFEHLTSALAHSDLKSIRLQFGHFRDAVAKPNPLLRTEFDRRMWTRFSGRIVAEAGIGVNVASQSAAQAAYNATKKALDRLQEHFSPADKPTFAGREIVLGPRAGDNYLVQHGLAEGELVVSRGNFKIDSALQIQARPSMMTPEGGGGGGHHHGGHGGGMKKAMPESHGGGMELPIAMTRTLKRIMVGAKTIADLTAHGDLATLRTTYANLAAELRELDDDAVDGHARLVWNDLKNLLDNDLFQGSNVKKPRDAQRVLARLQTTLNRLDRQFGLSRDARPLRYQVSPRFQQQLAALWKEYAALSDALAHDKPKDAAARTAAVQSAVENVDMKLLTDQQVHQAWMRELANLKKVLRDLAAAKDLKTQREHFWSLSQEMQVLSLAFGFGADLPVYRHFCHMAFNNTGAFWLQPDRNTRNPYFGSAMYRCYESIQLIDGPKDDSTKTTPAHRH
jgi:multidrug efflux pump subunit AcrA (membrane-fusion protein)